MNQTKHYKEENGDKKNGEVVLSLKRRTGNRKGARKNITKYSV